MTQEQISYLAEMTGVRGPMKREPEGKPLAVCINDCQIDYGQSRSELRQVCFQLHCAFAELRWGAPGKAASRLHELSNAS